MSGGARREQCFYAAAHALPVEAVPQVQARPGGRLQQSEEPVLRIRIRRINMVLGLLDPDPDPLVRGTDTDPSIIKKK